MKVIVVGCGRMGSELAYRLFKQGHDVAVVDREEEAFNHLPADFQGRLFEGDALNQDVLERAGIKTADAFAAVTEIDSINLVVCHVARDYYKVPHIVSRNFDPMYRNLYEAFNLQVVSATSWAAQRLEELVYHSDLRTIFSAGNGEVELYEMSVPKSWHNQKVGKLTANQTCIAVSITRTGRSFIPTAETILETDDVVLFSATLEGIETLRKRVGLHQEEA